MDLTTKLILASSIVLTSCSINPLEPLYKNIKINEIVINDAIRTNPNASSIIQINRNDEHLAILSSHSNGIYRWVNSMNEQFITENGKVIKVIGTDYDFDIINYKGFLSKSNKNKALLRFKDPDSGYLEIFFEYKKIKKGTLTKPISGEYYSYTLYQEDFYVPLIGWKGTNFYWVDNDKNVWLTKQELEPFGTKIRLKLLKKYSR
tara:strand:+ start:885 stop:1499 length:615 start_codon:yes stop_codon:yes gene_type:complete